MGPGPGWPSTLSKVAPGNGNMETSSVDHVDPVQRTLPVRRGSPAPTTLHDGGLTSGLAALFWRLLYCSMISTHHLHHPSSPLSSSLGSSPSALLPPLLPNALARSTMSFSGLSDFPPKFTISAQIHDSDPQTPDLISTTTERPRTVNPIFAQRFVCLPRPGPGRTDGTGTLERLIVRRCS
jgi:hypothetical protein